MHTRSHIMSRVRQKDTGPEIMLRSSLHQAGLRYRLHVKELPGSPDLVFPRFKAVAFVHGCYWHSHGCYRSTVPKSRRAFWMDKFSANRARDSRNMNLLRLSNWRVLVVWECALVGNRALPLSQIREMVRTWLNGDEERGEIAGLSTSHTKSPLRIYGNRRCMDGSS